ncbi:MAG TPA: hypothetical protein VI685_10060 [Candidatus Angelobacter sp.]
MQCNSLKAVLSIGIVLMVACSEAPKNESNGKPFPSTPVTGKTAFWELYKSAHSWEKTDLMPLKLESKTAPGVKNEAGNAAIWTGTFGSPKQHAAIVITYAVAAIPPDIAKGINVGHPFPWAGPTNDALNFQTSDLTTDSDAAYKTALAKAEPWLKKHPDKEVSFALGNAARWGTPVWYVLWGDPKTGYSVYVNAKTGVVAKPR